MRTDVKVGLICGLLVAGGTIAYISWPSHPAASVADDHSANNVVITGPSASAAPVHTSLFGPSVARASDAQPTTAPGLSAPPGFAGPGLSTDTTTPPAAGAPSGITPAPTGGNTIVLEPPTPAGPTGAAPTPPGPSLSGPATTAPALSPPNYGSASTWNPTPGATPSGGPTLQLEATPPTPVTTTYVIKSGDNFSKIAKATFGNTKFATITAIEQANPGVDSKHLKIGQKINLPALPTVAAAVPPGSPSMPGLASDTPAPTTRPASAHTSGATVASAPLHNLAGTSYTVKKGDDLHKIAKEVYGDQSRWKQIARTNRDVLDDPDDLQVGMVIKLPPA